MSRRQRYNSDTLWRLHEIGGADLALRYVELSDDAARNAESRDTRREPTLRSLRFYSGPRHPPAISEREFASSFARSKTQFVYFQIELDNPWEYVSWTYRICSRYLRPDGGTVGEIEDECVTQPGTVTFMHSRGWGWDEPGRWVVGTHRIEILLDGQSIASGEFSIEEDEPFGLLREPRPSSLIDFRKLFPDLARPLQPPTNHGNIPGDERTTRESDRWFEELKRSFPPLSVGTRKTNKPK
jgi:hypothetical protein